MVAAAAVAHSRRFIKIAIVRRRPLASINPSIRHKKRLTIWIVRCDCECGINVTYMCNGYSVSDYILNSLCIYILRVRLMMR